MTELDQYYDRQPEPHQSCFLALRDLILAQDVQIRSVWKWNTPFFYYGDRMICYLNWHKKHRQPYLAFLAGRYLEHASLLAEGRTMIKILPVDSEQDLPVDTLVSLLKQAIELAQRPK